MKKFFKALALVLALVLVIGAIPASAATTFTMKKDVKRVYLGGAQGKKADGTQCKTSSKYRISKLINGFDPATMTLKLESSDKSIVKTNNSKRKVYGKKIGSATVSIAVYDKESDILLSDSSLSVKIEVKKNADPAGVTFYVLDANGNPVDPTAKYALNTAYTVVISRKDANGNLIDTDKRSIVCTSANKDDVEIKAANDYTTKYTVTFKKAGDYTFAISNYQSKTWDAPINTFEFPAVAGYVVNDVKQVALDKVLFTFDTEVSNLVAENFNTYYEVTDANGKISKVYPTAAQDPVAIDSTDKTKATVTFLSDFEGGRTYYFEYGDSKKREDITYEDEKTGEKVRFSILAATVNADAADRIIIPEQTVVAGVPTAISYQIVDKNGIDIKSYIIGLNKGDFYFELANADIDSTITNPYDSNPEIFIGKVNDKAYTVNATYSWVDAEGKTHKAVGTGVVRSVAEAVSKRDMSKTQFMVSNDGNAFIKDGKINADAKYLTPWSVSDENVVLQTAIAYVNDKTGAVTYEGLGTVNGLEFEKYYVKSSNDAVVMIGTQGAGIDEVELIANQKGSASIIVYGQNTGKADVVVGIHGVTVVEERKVTKITVEANKKVINTAYAADEIKFTVKLIDQFSKSGTVDGVNKVKITKVNGDVTFGELTKDAGEIIVEGTDFTGVTANKKNAVILKFAYADNAAISETVQIYVGNEGADKVNKYNLMLTGSDKSDKLETCVNAASKQENITVKILGETGNGFAYDDGTNVAFLDKKPQAYKVATAEAVKYVYTVSKNGTLITADNALNVCFDKVNNTFTNLKKGAAVKCASGDAVKLDAGTYVIEAFKVSYNGKDMMVFSSIGKASFVVTDSQPKATITTRDIAERLSYDNLDSGNDAVVNAEVRKALKVVYDNADVTDIVTFNAPNTGFKVNGESKSAYVGKAIFFVGNDTVGYFQVVAPTGPNNGGVVVRTN